MVDTSENSIYPFNILIPIVKKTHSRHRAFSVRLNVIKIRTPWGWAEHELMKSVFKGD